MTQEELKQKRKTQEWITAKVKYIEGLKNPNESEKLFLALVRIPEPDAAHQRKLDAIVKAFKAQDRARAAQVKVDKVLNVERVKEKKIKADELRKRNHRLITLGLLIDSASLKNRSKAEILGVLMAASKVDDAERWAFWSKVGTLEMAKFEAQEEDIRET